MPLKFLVETSNHNCFCCRVLRKYTTIAHEERGKTPFILKFDDGSKSPSGSKRLSPGLVTHITLLTGRHVDSRSGLENMKERDLATSWN